MRLPLRGDRDESAVPTDSPLHSDSGSEPASLAARAGRLGAWARESLAARGLAVIAGLGVLALIGSSALARGPAAAPAGAALSPVSSGVVATAPPVAPAPADAGAPATAVEESAPPDAERAGPAPSVRRATPDDPVDLNTATPDDLRRLPGVGGKRALAIIALRSRLPGGHIKQIEDLLKVKGIGRAMLKRLRPLVRIR